jgi:ABC-2 type transport system permease protein
VSSPSDLDPTQATVTAAAPPPAQPAGVIHDIGYRPYVGPRLSEGAVAWSLFLTGLRHCFGLGRSGRSKVLPIGVLAAMLLPAVILVAVLVQAREALGLTGQIVPYSRYAVVTQVLISVFVAAQAPALISRDLRFRTLTLYLARPLRRSTYVLVRMASLLVAVFVLVAAPLLVLYVGGLLADLPPGRETKLFLGALVGALLLAAVLSGLAAVIAAVTTRRGLAVAAIIVVLVVSYTVVAAVQGIAVEQDMRRLAELAGLFSPYTLVDGVQVWLFSAPPSTPAPPRGSTGELFALLVVLVVAGSVLGMLTRYRRMTAI